jgi:hypothetical protein
MLKKIFVLGLMLTLASCASTISSKQSDDGWKDFCLNASPIEWSKTMTDKQISQIKIHNAKGVAHCGW